MTLLKRFELMADAASALDFERDDAQPARPAAAPDLLVATIYRFDAPVDRRFLRFFQHDMRPEFAAADIRVLGFYASSEASDDVESATDHVFVWFALYRDADDYAARSAALDETPGWHKLIEPALRRRTRGEEVQRLALGERLRVEG